MRNTTRATAVAISAVALSAFALPAAQAATTGIIVCVKGTNGNGAHVSINKTGPGGFREGTANTCKGFGNLSSGDYFIDIDPPSGYHIGDDDKVIHINRGETETVRFYVTKNTPTPPPPAPNPPAPSGPTCSHTAPSYNSQPNPACQYTPAAFTTTAPNYAPHGAPTGTEADFERCVNGSYTFVPGASATLKTGTTGLSWYRAATAAPPPKCQWNGNYPIGASGKKK